MDDHRHFDVERLLRQELVGTTRPWSSGRSGAVDRFLRKTVRAVERRARVKSRNEFDHYGSGYASYVDAWFYRPQPEFATGAENGYRGLVVLLSRLTQHFAVGEGVKSWTREGTGSSYLPCFEMVDRFESPAVKSLVPDVEAVLNDRGLVRLRRRELERPLPESADVPTILSDGPFRLFDAIFHWED